MADNANDTKTVEPTNGVEIQLKSIEEGVKNFTQKAKDTEAELATVKKEAETVRAELLTLKEASVTKDETLKKVIEAQDKMIAERKSIPIYNQVGEKSFEQVLAEKLKENEPNLIKMINKEPGRPMEWSIELSKAEMNTKAVGDVTIANYTGGTRGLTALRPGILAQPPRKVHVRDILSTGTIGPGTEYTFMKENGAGEGAIASVAETATKPQIDVDLIEASVKIETIAGWLRVSRKAMNNIQGFVSWLQMRLPEKLMRVEDNLLLNGDGVTPNIKGIQVAGNFTAATAAQALADIEEVIRAMEQLETLDHEATGIVLHPTDYFNIMLNKAALTGAYDLPKIVTLDESGVLRILGVPVVRTNAQTVDKFLVGDFIQGAQLLIQEGIRIEFFEQDGTNVRENKVTVRIEETVAFPVYGAEFFIFGDFTA